MSGVLDELRAAVESLVYQNTHHGRGNTTIMEIQDCFARFEAEHPGLVDYTATCPRCGKAYDNDVNFVRLVNRFGQTREFVCRPCAEGA